MQFSMATSLCPRLRKPLKGGREGQNKGIEQQGESKTQRAMFMTGCSHWLSLTFDGAAYVFASLMCCLQLYPGQLHAITAPILPLMTLMPFTYYSAVAKRLISTMVSRNPRLRDPKQMLLPDVKLPRHTETISREHAQAHACAEKMYMNACAEMLWRMRFNSCKSIVGSSHKTSAVSIDNVHHVAQR